MEDGPFRYHLELTPEQLKLTHTALRSLLDDFGHDQPEMLAVIHEVLAKLPDDHAIRAIRIGKEEPSGEVVELAPDPDGGEPVDPIDPISA
jgi:hypothetical protein